jgi:hypothetical protein
VMMMAITPSLNISSRFLPIFHFPLQTSCLRLGVYAGRRQTPVSRSRGEID